MKKLLSSLLILSLLCMLAMPVFAVNNDIEDIGKMLNDSYNGVETQTQFGYFVPFFTVFKDKAGVINICADSSYFVFHDVQFSNAPLEDKQLATANIKKHMEKIAKAVMTKYPKHKFKGWYESTFTNSHNEEVTIRHDTWTNIYEGKLSKKIVWLTGQDSEWVLSLPAK